LIVPSGFERAVGRPSIAVTEIRAAAGAPRMADRRPSYNLRAMLPASFQAPAAVILLVGGLLSCFVGYRVFRLVLAFFGFVFGVLFASSVMGGDQTIWMIAAALAGGLAGALILFAAYFVGVALIGAGFGAGIALVVWAALGREPGIVPVIILAIAGAIGALALQRYVIIIATAFGGAQTAIVGGAALMSSRSLDASARSVFRVYPLDPLPATRWDLVGFALLSIVGLIVQLRKGGK
jgi:hypothetical protein